MRPAEVAKPWSPWACEPKVAAIGADNMAWDVPNARDPETATILLFSASP
jgi:hypothetical protein